MFSNIDEEDRFKRINELTKVTIPPIWFLKTIPDEIISNMRWLDRYETMFDEPL